MKEPCISKSKKILVSLAAVVLFLTVIFSAFYIAAEADHDCTGESCPVCAVIQLCENFLRQAGSGNGVSVFEAVLNVSILFVAVFSSLILIKKTPVSQKIRLNN